MTLQTRPTQANPALPTIVRGDRQRKLLTEPVIFEEGSLPPFLRLALIGAAVLVGAFILWTSLVSVDEVASAAGQVIPSDYVKVIEHLEGGTVAEVRVAEGQLVAAGDVLVRMDPAPAQSELEQLKARELALTLRAERLRAVTDGRQPDFSAFAAAHPDQVADQQRIWASQMTARHSALEVIDAQVAQRNKEVAQLKEQLAVAERQLELTRDQLKIRQDGVHEGVVSRQVYLETKRGEVTAEGEVVRLREQIRVASETLQETERRRRNLNATQQQDALTELGTVTAELEQVKGALIKAQDRVNRLEVRAPVAGLVQDIKIRTPGEVLPAGGILMRIVPVDDTLVAEVRILPSDIGHVQAGQPVRVKFATYDYTRYGAMPGTLEEVSPSTFMDEQGHPYYKGMVRLARPWMGPGEGQNRVLPGMSVDADIVTGHKPLFQYLLRPVYISLKSSFHER